MGEGNEAGRIVRVLETPADEPAESRKGEPSKFDAYLPDLPVERTAPAASPESSRIPTLRSARLIELKGRSAAISWRGSAAPVEAVVAPDVEEALLALALRNRDGVLVEVAEGESPVIVGVVQTRLPREIHLAGEEIHFDAAREILLRAGRAALRLREDGDVELIGSHISATSRGLFRLVGRILRLN